MLQLTKPLAVIDLETTGVSLGSDRIIEIAIVKIMPDGKKLVKRKLINPEMPIPAASTEIHGIYRRHGCRRSHLQAGRQ